jgi:predicted ATP-grasp superfamily ATP-dependent carboligase
MKVLVTGAEEHQGLAVIRGLGLKGVPVVACGASPRSLGFYSRFATERYSYTSPLVDGKQFIEDIAGILDGSGAELIIPAVESTLVALDASRERIETTAVLAAPDSETLDVAIDKLRTVRLAEAVGVPAPRTASAATVDAVLDLVKAFRFPVAIKPRGNGIHAKTRHRFHFKVKYANSPAALRQLLESIDLSKGSVLVQELAPGVGVCVSAVFCEGRPLVQFAYRRLREWPITGGVSVLRKSVRPDERLTRYVNRLLGTLKWHGVAMVEFKHDERRDDYVLMEINGRFQASTALSLDAGLNLPYIVYCLYSGTRLEDVYSYRAGVSERWIRGDWLSLLDYLFGDTIGAAPTTPDARLPSKRAALADFVRAFRPSVRYDEIKSYDWRPALVEALTIGRLTGQRIRAIAGRRAAKLSVPVNRRNGA